MEYTPDFKLVCQKAIAKATRRNPLLQKILKKKISQIIENPEHYKPLKYDLRGERRVHIMNSFILKFSINQISKIVTFLSFDHHDDAYRK